MTTQDEAPPLEGRPISHPAESAPDAPKTPQGIDSNPVPAEVREGTAHSEGTADPAVSLPDFEVPVSRDAEPGPLAARLADGGLDAARLAGAAVRLVTAGSARADGAETTISLSAGQLRIETAGPPRAVDATTTLGVAPDVVLQEPTVAHDPFADRFLLVARASPQAGAAEARVLIAVSGDATASGPWHRTEVKVDGGGSSVLIGLALDEQAVYILLEGAEGRSRVISIARDTPGRGFYAGEGARVHVSMNATDGRGHTASLA